MSCEICGRGGCTRSFHSLESQEEFDNKADEVKERAREVLENKVDRLKGEHIGDDYYVKLEDVIEIIRNYY